MHRRFIPFTIALLCFASPGLLARPPEGGKTVQVFILAGQSNMEGKAAVSTLDAVIDDGIKLVNIGKKFGLSSEKLVRDSCVKMRRRPQKMRESRGTKNLIFLCADDSNFGLICEENINVISCDWF